MGTFGRRGDGVTPRTLTGGTISTDRGGDERATLGGTGMGSCRGIGIGRGGGVVGRICSKVEGGRD